MIASASPTPAHHPLRTNDLGGESRGPAASVGLSASALPRTSRLGTVAAVVVGGVLVSLAAIPAVPGIGLGVAGVVVAAVWLLVARLRDRAVGRRELLVVCSLVVFAALPALRASPWLILMDFGCLGLLWFALPVVARGRVGTVSLIDAAALGYRAAANTVAGAVHVVQEDIDTRSLAVTLRGPALGLLVATPVSIVFLLLFADADAVFANLIEQLLVVDASSSWQRVGVASAVAWVVLGGVWAMARMDRGPVFARTIRLPLGRSEIQWAVSLLVALFLVFVIVQGIQVAGFSDALTTSSITYSSAARAGFFQLLVVVGLVLLVTLVATLGTRGQGEGEEGERLPAVLRWTLRALLFLTLLVAASALLRMARYIDAYGLSELRFYASAGMVFFAGLLIWAERTVVSGVRGRFLPGTAVFAIAGVLVLHAVSPDARIVEVNLARGEKADVSHLFTLSEDALPAIVDGAAALPPAKRAEACALVQQRAGEARWRLDHESWRSLTLPLVRAQHQNCPT